MAQLQLPNFALDATQPFAQHFAARGLTSYHEAAAHVWRLPYGRTSQPSNLLRVLEEGRGTCSSKHALLAALAREHGQPVELWLGLYTMDEANTPGIGLVLAEYGLACLPEAHCYLVYAGHNVDLSTPRGTLLPGLPFLRRERITPEQSSTYK